MTSAAVQQLLAQNRFLRLASSREIYPDAPGEGLPLLQVVTDQCQAVIALQGGQLLSFQPLAGPALLWLSPQCQFKPGKALRGGVPVCLPWFGPHPEDRDKPQHGYARTSDWTLTDAGMRDDGRCELELTLESDANPLFAHAFAAQLHLLLGEEAQLTLSITNRSEKPFDCSWALHSYFPVADLEQVRVAGLANKTYLDNLDGLKEKTQTNDLAFVGEVDRVFPEIHNPVVIQGEPSIEITHHNCPSVITWNPGPDKAAAMADVGAGHERGFICVERGAVKDEHWTLEPGECRSGWIKLATIP